MKPTTKDFIYVLLQLLLFIAYLFRIAEIDFKLNSLLQYAGLGISIIGIGIITLAFTDLKSNLTPFPSPKQSSTLITTGIYKYIRHPIYTGLLLITAGYGVYSENTLRLLIFGALFILFNYKARYEEALLSYKFPEYRGYKTKTARFFPRLF